MAIRREKEPEIHWPPRPDEDQAYITEHGKARGSKKYEYTREEARKLKDNAIAIGMNSDIIEQFEQAFNYMHEVPKWMRKGTFNSICGWGFDASVRNYAKIADAIWRGERNVKLDCRFSSFSRE